MIICVTLCNLTEAEAQRQKKPVFKWRIEPQVEPLTKTQPQTEPETQPEIELSLVLVLQTQPSPLLITVTVLITQPDDLNMRLYLLIITIVIYALLIAGTYLFAFTLLNPQWPTEMRLYCILLGLLCLALAAFLGKLRTTTRNCSSNLLPNTL